MPTNRVIYQTEALFAGPAPATGIHHNYFTSLVNQIHRVQTCNYGYTLNRRDVNQYGELAAIDRILLESPTINLDFSYLNSTFYNETKLGFYVNSGQGDSSCITNILNKTEDDRNYFIKTLVEGVDSVLAYHYSGASTMYASIGNGFISNFSTEGAVGDFPRTTITVEGLNILFQHSVSGLFYIPSGFDLEYSYNYVNTPAVNPSDGRIITGIAPIPCAVSSPIHPFAAAQEQDVILPVYRSPYSISALRPGDITIDILSAGTQTPLNELGVNISDAKIQSYNLNFSLSRDSLQKIGSKYAFAREIRFPVQVNLSLEANVGDLMTGNLSDAITIDNSYDVAINIAHPNTGSFKVMKYTLKNAKLDAQNYTSSIGTNKSVTLNFSSQIGGPLQTNNGLFFSGYLPAMPYP